MYKLPLLLSLPLACILSDFAQAAKAPDKGYRSQAIYGEDDRFELFEVRGSKVAALARSSVALVNDENIEPAGTHYQLRAKTFGEDKDLCDSERFYEQETPAFCSGTLVGPDLVLTAGHCFDTLSDCEKTKFVFDFAKTSASNISYRVKAENVYSCESLLYHSKRQKTGKGKSVDFALVQLDRAVTGRRPVKLQRTSGVVAGDAVLTLGYPSGLPLKFALNGTVRGRKRVVFENNLDVYGGNSGAAIFNANTFKIEGIVIDGEEDFVKENGCYISKRCKETSCDGESALYANIILDKLEEAAVHPW